MKNILVSSISDQLIPNYLLYTELSDTIDGHIIITTPLMNKKGVYQNFVNCLDSSKPIISVELDNFKDFEGISNKIAEELSDTEGLRFYVNLTGGTKVMAFAVMNHFQKLDSKMFYVGIGDNSYQEILPVQQAEHKFKEPISLKNYLKLYGLDAEYDNRCILSKKKTIELFKVVEVFDYNALSVNKILRAIESEDKTSLGKYYRGEWFEEYTYHLLKETLGLGDEQIAFNVKLRRNQQDINEDNQYDVMFVKNNKLYVVECKSSVGKRNEGKNNMEPMLYKLAAVVKDMGIQVTPIFAALAPLDKEKWMEKRAFILGVKLLGAEKFENKMLLKTYLKLM